MIFHWFSMVIFLREMMIFCWNQLQKLIKENIKPHNTAKEHVIVRKDEIISADKDRWWTLIKHDEFWMKNHEIWMKNDEFWMKQWWILHSKWRIFEQMADIRPGGSCCAGKDAGRYVTERWFSWIVLCVVFCVVFSWPIPEGTEYLYRYFALREDQVSSLYICICRNEAILR